MPAPVDISGEQFGRLTVIALVSTNPRLWQCRCECGTVVTHPAGLLRYGTVKSCGCWKRDQTIKRNFVHGMAYTPEHEIWRAMKRRCYGVGNKAFCRYGGRGIDVCKRWLKSFPAFLEDMGTRPSPSHSIERLRNNEGYKPDNCIWGTPTQQARNKRNNHLMTFHGITKSMAEWADAPPNSALSYTTIRRRSMLGWSDEDALSRPLREW